MGSPRGKRGGTGEHRAISRIGRGADALSPPALAGREEDTCVEWVTTKREDLKKENRPADSLGLTEKKGGRPFSSSLPSSALAKEREGPGKREGGWWHPPPPPC